MLWAAGTPDGLALRGTAATIDREHTRSVVSSASGTASKHEYGLRYSRIASLSVAAGDSDQETVRPPSAERWHWGDSPISVYLSKLSLSPAFGFRQTPGNLLPMGE